MKRSIFLIIISLLFITGCGEKTEDEVVMLSCMNDSSRYYSTIDEVIYNSDNEIIEVFTTRVTN